MTTRNKNETFTSYRTLTSDYAPDGGSYIPFRMPRYDKKEISAIKELGFSQIVAEQLNMFFSCGLTGWDVEFCIGRNPCRCVSMNHRIIISELWHNPAWKYSYLEQQLYERICKSAPLLKKPTAWATIAIRVAILFGIFGELLRNGEIAEDQTVDIALRAGDFSAPVAAWIGRKMGLPIGVIVCTCDTDGVAWDLIHRGTLNTALADEKLRCGIEQLLCVTLGTASVGEFLKKCEKSITYSIDEEQLPVLNSGMFCTVSGENRAASIINSIFRSNSYIIDPDTAICFGGVQDYRAKSGESRTTLLLSEQSPLNFSRVITEATGITGEKLFEFVKP